MSKVNHLTMFLACATTLIYVVLCKILGMLEPFHDHGFALGMFYPRFASMQCNK
jgi:hypothetical protein